MTTDYRKQSVAPVEAPGLKELLVTADPWTSLRQFTDARIALGRCGCSMPLATVMDLRLAHARAKDAVHSPLETDRLKAQLAELGLPAMTLKSAAENRGQYLERPDLGRRLDAASSQALALHRPTAGVDIALIVGDGLSARAIHENAIPFVGLFSQLCAAKTNLRLGPVCVVNNCRVATGDEIGELLGARVTVMLIGERPGLSSPNSMGIYLTHAPRIGVSDEARNCISNIRQGGMSVAEGVRKLAYLLEEALHLRTSGVALKDRVGVDYLPFERLARLPE